MDFLIGYFGAGNVGDDAILQAYLLKNKNPGKILWNSKKSALNHVEKEKTLDVLKNILLADRIIFPGGGIIQDKTSFSSLLFYTGIIFIASLLKKKVYMLSQSLGPIGHTRSKFFVKVLNNVEVLALREPLSISLAKRLRLKSDIVKEVSDITLTIDFVLPKKEKIFGINLRACEESSRSVQELVIFSERLRGEGFLIRGVAFDKEDERFLKSLPIKFDEIFYGNFINTFRSVAECEVFVATRFHSAVFCTKSLTPFVAIDYDPKVRGFMRQIGLEEYCYKSLSFENLVKFYNNKKFVEKQIALKISELEKLAFKNFEFV
ncbi:polysaccharide pyruvyl transferase [Thermodesulfobium narugense DSM 14796]|uniref:Polysaccharide pyruvyl transferase n=1 Tax=Thermodesulfobium narugense DSM 14796 TaxID=747365 RepID=M1E518_9BACT|nr:polysaccharide pyruvyl transferase family protein [Thermodesulfobium narugense]AEE13941.1 polysaccharide pyruvyl transferase [Thermodesulfobium narugense DSM 14796]